jgi:hypothetical protein
MSSARLTAAVKHHRLREDQVIEITSQSCAHCEPCSIFEKIRARFESIRVFLETIHLRLESIRVFLESFRVRFEAIRASFEDDERVLESIRVFPE